MIEPEYPRVPEMYQKLYEFTVVNLGVSHEKANIAVTAAWLGDPKYSCLHNVSVNPRHFIKKFTNGNDFKT